MWKAQGWRKVTMDESWREPAVFRSEMYRLLGYCMLEPIGNERAALLKPDFWLNFALEPANDSMRTALEKLGRISARLALLSESKALETVQLEYMSLFLGPGEPLAPPWESMYTTNERLMFGQPALEVRAAMAGFGVELVAKYSQPEDHLGLELMLLATVAERDAQGTEADWRKSAGLQADFIKKHPLSWIEKLSQDADAHSDTGFYAAIVKLIHGVLLWDLELLKEHTDPA